MSPTTSWGEAGTHMDTSPRQDGRGLLRPQPPRKERVLGNNSDGGYGPRISRKIPPTLAGLASALRPRCSSRLADSIGV